MITIVARVLRTLSGHSAAAQVQLLDEHGHEHKLEIPFELAQRIEPGSLMVLQWSTHSVPGEVIVTGPAPEVANRAGVGAVPARPLAQVLDALREESRGAPSSASTSATTSATTNASTSATTPPAGGPADAAQRWISDLFRSK